jgi:hypothetical protein
VASVVRPYGRWPHKPSQWRPNPVSSGPCRCWKTYCQTASTFARRNEGTMHCGDRSLAILRVRNGLEAIDRRAVSGLRTASAATSHDSSSSSAFASFRSGASKPSVNQW